MENAPNISVVIITYNFAKFIREALDSVLAQTLMPSEIIVYDDCSTDGSWDIILEYQHRHPALIVAHRHPRNVGMQANANAALRAARGDLVSWLDGDDRWLAHKLEREWAALCSSPGAAVAYSNVYVTDEQGRRTGIWYDGNGQEPPSGDVFVQTFSKRFFPNSRSLFRNFLVYRSALQAMDYHDETIALYVDWDLKIRLAAHYSLAYSGEALVEYRIHPGGVHNRPSQTHLQDLVAIYRKNLPLLERRAPNDVKQVRAELQQLASVYGGTLPSASLAPASPAASGTSSYAGENLVFLVSLPRSGSTLLQRLLSAHPDIHSVAEPWVMLHPLYALKRRGIETEYEAELARRALDDLMVELPGGEQDYIEGLRRFAGVVYGKLLEGTGKRVFLDKTPRYYYVLPELIKVFPKAKFILLARNPAAVLSSMLRTWLDNDLEALQSHSHYQDLVRGPQLLAEGARLLGESAHRLRYEDLVDAPEDAMHKLYRYLGLEPASKLLDYRPEGFKGRFGDPARVDKHTTVVVDYRDSWCEHLATEPYCSFAADYLESLSGSTLQTLGYDRRDVVERIRGIRGDVDDTHAEPLEIDRPPAEGQLPRELNAVGEAAFASGDMDRAEASFRAAYALDQDNVESCNNLLVLYWHRGDTQQALHYLERALQLNGKDRNVVLNGGQILEAYGYSEEAAGLYTAYLADNPGDAAILRLLDDLNGETRRSSDQPGPAVAEGGRRDVSVRPLDYSSPELAAQAPSISIVIPSFNQAEYLEVAIRSVLDQRYPNLQLIVMDGGSSDGSVEIIKRYADRLHYWQSAADEGQYWAINEGFRRSSGQIMAWINSDDKLHVNSLNTMASIFSQREDVAWVTGTPNIMNEAGIITWICEPAPVFCHQNYLQKRYDFPTFIQQEGTFWRRELWDQAGATLQVDLQMAGDLELWARFFRHAPLYTASVCTGCFRQQGNQKTAKAMDLYRAEAERILEREIALFKASRNTAIAPVKPLKVQSAAAAPASAAQRALNDAVRTALPAVAHPLDTFSATPGSRKTTSTVQSMHGTQSLPLVSAIVSTYNSEKYLRACLEDLEAQTLASRLEIIVIDSGSQQREGEIVAEFQQRYSNIRYLRTEARETIYSAWNRAVGMASGKYVSNANTDDRHRPDAYERMVAVLERDPQAVLVYADAAVTGQENAGFTDAPISGWFRWPEFDARHLFSVCYIGPQPMWRRSLHDQYGYFDPKMRVAGDYDFWLRVAVHEKFVHLSEVLGLYLSSADSIEHAQAEVGALESEQARKRNWPTAWGQMPAPTAGYLEPAGGETTAEMVTATRRVQGPLVSVIMATKDRPELLASALQSVSRQTYPNWEIVLVNDGGQDVSGIVAAAGLGDKIICVNNPRSLGQAAARNLGLQKASGDIISILDDDDLYLAEHLQTVVTGLQCGECEFVYTDADLVQEKVTAGRRQELNRSAPYKHGAWSRPRLHIDNYIPINTWAFRRRCLEKIGGFDESLRCCEDWDFLLQLARHFEFKHIERTTVEVRHRIDVVDNVTRQRLDETEAVYRTIYARYEHCDGAELASGREQALKLLRDKREQLEDSLRTGPGHPDHLTDQGDENLLASAREKFAELVARHGYHCPAIHLFVTVGDADLVGLGDTLDALGTQIYMGWGLSILSTLEAPADALDQLPMVEWICCDDPSAMLSQSMQRSEGEWLAVLTPGDCPKPEALSRVVEYANNYPDWRFIYVDEYSSGADDQADEYFHKPDLNLDYLLAAPYLGGLCLLHGESREVLDEVYRYPQGVVLAACLGVIRRHGEKAVGHIDEVLNRRRRGADALPIGAEFGAIIQRHLRDSGINAAVSQGLLAHTFMIDYPLTRTPAVSILIYAVDDVQAALQTVTSILQKTDYANFSVRVAVTQDRAQPLRQLSDTRVQLELVSSDERRAQCLNRLARKADEFVLFIEPGIQILQDLWLRRLMAHLRRQDIGALGVRLVSPQRLVVHGGIFAGAGAFAVGDLAFVGKPMDDPGYMDRALVPQSVSAVSSAFLLMERALFVDVGGFDAELEVALFQDVDLGQRIRAAQRKVVWTPYVTLLYVGADLGSYRGDRSFAEVQTAAQTVTTRWLHSFADDPAYNRSLGLKQVDFCGDRNLTPTWNPRTTQLPVFVGYGAGSRGSWQYRVVQPLAGLQTRAQAHCIQVPFIADNSIRLPSEVEIARLRPQALLMHNTLHDDCLQALEKYKRINKAFVVFGQDDLLFAIPPKNPFSKTVYKDIKKRIRRCLGLADRLLVTTEALASGLRNMADDIRILPNYLDDRVWADLVSERNVARKPRAGWAGAQQHRGDLEMMEQVLKDTAGEVDWVFFGMCPDCLRPYVKEVHEAVSFEQYPQRLADLNLDLAIAPLEHNRFNEAKSNLRLLEYGALGWPVIASDIEPYRGAPVCLVRNQPRAWVSAIRERAADLEATWKEGDRLRAWVHANWMLSQHGAQWLAALDPDSSVQLTQTPPLAGAVG